MISGGRSASAAASFSASSGGTIGRSADNDWVLPDPLRYVSAHHARISFREGHYYLEDLSTNGVLRQRCQAAGRQARPAHRLQNGDLLRLGEYQIVVALETEIAPEALKAERSDGAPAACPPAFMRCARVGRVAQTDIGAQLDLDELLVVATPARTRFQPVNAYGQAGRPRAAAQSLLSRPEPAESAIARRIARLAKAAGRDAAQWRERAGAL